MNDVVWVAGWLVVWAVAVVLLAAWLSWTLGPVRL